MAELFQNDVKISPQVQKTQQTPNKINTKKTALRYIIAKLLKSKNRDLPGGPVGRTPHSQCRGPGFNAQGTSRGTRSYMHATTKKPTCHN